MRQAGALFERNSVELGALGGGAQGQGAHAPGEWAMVVGRQDGQAGRQLGWVGGKARWDALVPKVLHCESVTR